ncbi:MAG TPA: DcaP family trimeric outer membrane transporter [Terriglobales bacterium]|nr:DcaP family trimeric outer membrane transporter [Terriglobales bacterium]
MPTHRRFTVFCATGTLILLSLITPALGQVSTPQSPDLQQLVDKLQRLEQEMQEIKGQIRAVQQTQKANAEIVTQAMQIQVTQDTPKAPAERPPAEEEKKTTLDLYGFVMLDAGYDFKTNDPDWFDVVRPTKLPSFSGQFAPDGKVYFGVRQTRFGVKTGTDTPLGKLKTQFEFELFGTGVDAGQTTFRLRQAYGELGPFGAGQTWSPFMDPDVFPNTLEYWGPTGMVFFRNIQFRWMPIRSDNTRLTFAVERPGASADGGVYAGRIELQGVRPKFDLPDFSWQARFIRRWGYLQVAGIFRKISWQDTGNASPFPLGRDVLGWGINTSSNLKLSKKDIARLQVVYGRGIQNYMNDAPIDIGVKNTGNPSRPIEGIPLPVLGVVSFLDHTWNDRFSSSVGYSLENIDNSNAELPADFHQGHYAIGNLLFHPIPKVTMGSEFQFGRRVNFSDGFNVNDYRLQFGFKYDWGKSFEF